MLLLVTWMEKKQCIQFGNQKTPLISRQLNFVKIARKMEITNNLASKVIQYTDQFICNTYPFKTHFMFIHMTF